ncbi:hypothetical protein RB195_010978 [Necator americanus]|uniref:Uncharacterized protein n=1 Tax=Necator americanus TaxID=51031 RepID=A0ABR1D1L9_NECAM
MGGVLAGELCSNRRRWYMPWWRSIRRKVIRLTRRSSSRPTKMVKYDVQSFTVAELCLLTKKQVDNGACRSTIYQYEGYVKVLDAENMFQEQRKSSYGSPSTLPGYCDGDNDMFRIVIVSEYEDPFYLRTMALQLEEDQMEMERQWLQVESTQSDEEKEVSVISITKDHKNSARFNEESKSNNDESLRVKTSSKEKQARPKSSSPMSSAWVLSDRKKTQSQRSNASKAALFAATLQNFQAFAHSPQPERVSPKSSYRL